MDKTLEVKGKKHLGQYFSGSALASLLANLAKHHTASSIIDPMCGTGDMIAACEPLAHPNKQFFGIEIDSEISNSFTNRFEQIQNVKLINDNVFKPAVIEMMAATPFDLVITNPPYIRYQTIKSNKLAEPKSLTTKELKGNLVNALPLFKHLDLEDQKLFKILISDYSGLADLAVPSWLLCTLITKIGGRIAMVVPHAWLNRDYARVIHYLLLKWFHVEYIIEDANSVWFSSAQVKTTLIVAQRVKRKEYLNNWHDEYITYCSVFSKAKNELSIVGNAFDRQKNAQKLFIDAINTNKSIDEKFITDRIKYKDFANDLIRNAKNQRWFKSIEPQLETSNPNNLKIPSKLKDWLGDRNVQFTSLHDVGVNVGQGLRTGANFFFYMDIVEYRDKTLLVQQKKIFDSGLIEIPSEFYREVIQKQADLDNTFDISGVRPTTIVLNLRNGIRKKDYNLVKRLMNVANLNYKILPKQLDSYITKATEFNLGTQCKPKHLNLLSAVLPNVKIWNSDRPMEPPRFWYMLPQFSKRHCPDLFVPRVNGRNPITRLNNDNKYLIDANFSTIWIADFGHNYNIPALLALLNSSWCVVAMEEYGTVMGGGALKLEATQIRKLPIPKFDNGTLKNLTRLGRLMVENKDVNSEILKRIDSVIIKAMGMTDQMEEKLNEITQIKKDLLNKRVRQTKSSI